MKNRLRSLPVLLAVAFAGALASCSSNADTPGAVNVENGAAKPLMPVEGTPPAGMGEDSAVAGLHRNTSAPPTGEQLYENADNRVDHNHDGKADH
ncbi:hypothetical protein [Hymenobacter nivis]|uniref:Lipoprotein n=1 Tax=Hymenobacter nivis TaxID=1850093 RepID=A0A502GYP6_9BACT|nr:hypothetical protein [Hymenobacter nivis]TPG66994.1 hypothetical protein EAH73_04435 [Hymenobacter nivis]